MECHQDVVISVVDAGADIVLGMLPLAREFLRYGVEVVLCANTLPAINDITASELRSLIEQVAELCPIIKVHLSGFYLVRTVHVTVKPRLDLER